MPVPDAEAPVDPSTKPSASASGEEYSLGDCAICMDAIMMPLHPGGGHASRRASLHVRRKSFSSVGVGSEKSDRELEKELEKEEKDGRGILGAVQRGLEAAGRSTARGAAKKSYALAPCSHLFVSVPRHFISLMLNGFRPSCLAYSMSGKSEY